MNIGQGWGGEGLRKECMRGGLERGALIQTVSDSTLLCIYTNVT